MGYKNYRNTFHEKLKNTLTPNRIKKIQNNRNTWQKGGSFLPSMTAVVL